MSDLPHWLLERGKSNMKVLVHTGAGRRSYLLEFGDSVTREHLRQIIEGRHQWMVIQQLLKHASSKLEISSSDRFCAEQAADFVVSHQGYTSERLA